GTTVLGTSSTLKIPDAEYGKAINCTITLTNGTEQTVGTSTSKTAGVGAALVPTKHPVLSNRNRGGVVTRGTYEYCSTGTWTPTPNETYIFQWFLGSLAIRGASHAYFKIPSTYLGKLISCLVIARRLHYANGAYHTGSVRVAR